MVWRTRKVWVWLPRMGEGYWREEKYWVPDKPVQRSSGTSPAKRAAQRAAAAARARADAKAKADAERRAKEAAKGAALAGIRRRAASRSAMWAELQGAAVDARSLVARPTTGRTRTGSWTPKPQQYGPPTPANIVKRRQDQERAAAEARANALRMGPQGVIDAIQKAGAQAVASQRIADRIEKREKKKGHAARGLVYENMLARVLAGQVGSDGKNLDTDLLEVIDKGYSDHVQGVVSDFNGQVDKLRKFYVLDKDGNLIKPKNTPEAYAGINKILGSQAFKDAEDELERLYGKAGAPGKAGKGTLTTAMTARDQIGMNQRKYLHDIAYNSILAKRNLASRTGEGEMAMSASKDFADWQKGGKYAFGYFEGLIDPAKTSKVTTYDKKTGKMVTVARTPEEEYEHRKAQYEAELRREYAAFKNRQTAQLQMDRHLSAELYSSEAVQQNADKNVIAPVMKALNLTAITSQKDLEQVVRLSTAQYAKQTRDKVLPDWQVVALEAGQAYAIDPATGKRVYILNTPEYERYKGLVDDAKKRYFNYFGSEDPGVLGEISKIPFVPEAMEAFGIGTGAIGSMIRIPAKALTGSSRIDLFIDYTKLPTQHLRDLAQRAFGAQAGFASMGNRLGAADIGAATHEFYQWFNGSAGTAWYAQYKADLEAKSREEDVAFTEGLTGGGDLWQQLKAIGAYGNTPFTNDAANLAFQLLVDPTNALPLKATTWLARLKSARTGTAGISGFGGLKRATLGVHRWATVTEPELRLEKALAPYIKKLDAGVNPADVREMILERLGGIKDKSKRERETDALFRSLGIEKRSASGHQISSFTEEALLRRFEKAGLDYRDVAKKARELEFDRAAREQAEKDAKSARIKAADKLRRDAEQEAAAEFEASAARTKEEYAAQKAALEARAARVEPVVTERPVAATAPTPETVVKVEPTEVRVGANPVRATTKAADPLANKADDPTHRSATTGDPDPVHVRMREEDPLRETAGPGVETMEQAHRDVLGREGIEFAPGAYSETFKASPAYAKLLEDLEATLPGGNPNTKVREAARRDLYEVARRSNAERLAKEEGLDPDLLDNGVIPWEERMTKDGTITGYSVRGGRSSSKQYIVRAREYAERMGARSPAEEAVVLNELHALEGAKRRLLSLRKAAQTKKITLEQLADELDKEEGIRSFGVVRRSPLIAADMAAQGAESAYGVIDDILEAHKIPLGEQMVTDLLTPGELRDYYETFSLIPGLMSGSGYNTLLMENIINPAWRATFKRSDLTNMMRQPPFVDFPGPKEFRANGSHLFALFHLTLLDGNTKLLQSYSRSMNTVLKSDPYNVYARMWRVMETRTGVPWADPAGFVAVEDAFMRAVLGDPLEVTRFGQVAKMHPNLALGMIPNGPMARSLPKSRGFSKHLKGLTTTSNPLFAAAPAHWVDEDVIESLTSIAKKKGTVEDRIRVASQIIDYIASRYGNVGRRSQFRMVAQDFNIKTSLRFRRTSDSAEAQLQDLRSEWIEEQKVSTLKRQAKGIDVVQTRKTGEYLEEATEEMVGVETLVATRLGTFSDTWVRGQVRRFNNMITKGAKPGMKRTDYPELRATYDRLYWENRVTHENPGLHTANFLLKMQEETIQRGNSWVKYANSYFDHMVGAGAADEATEILKVIFEPEIGRVANSMFEQVTDLGESVSPEMASGIYRGRVIGFMIKAKLLPENYAMVIEEGRRRAHASMSYAQKEVDDQAMRDEFAIADDIDRFTDEMLNPDSRATVADPQSLWDNADLSALGDEAVGYVDAIEANALRAENLTIKGVKRPSEARVVAAKKMFLRTRKKSGLSAAKVALYKLPDDVQQWVLHDVAQADLQFRVRGLLRSMVFRVRKTNAIPDEVAQQFATLVDLVADMPGGGAVLAKFADEFAGDLMGSRLIDYSKHLEYFVFNEARDVVGNRQLLPTREELARIAALKGDLKADIVGRTPEAEAQMKARLSELEDAAKVKVEAYRADRAKDRVATPDEALADAQAADVVDEAIAVEPVEPTVAAAEAPMPPDPAQLNHARVSMAQRGLELFGKMSEEEWMMRELNKARRAWRQAGSGSAEKARAYSRIRDIERAFKVIEVSKTGGSYIPHQARSAFARRIRGLTSERARAMINHKYVAPYVAGPGGATIEQGRSLYRLWKNSKVDAGLGSLRHPGEVTPTYRAHGEQIEEEFGRTINPDYLLRFGFPADLLDDISGTTLLTDADEFAANSLRIPKFEDLLNVVTTRMQTRLREITGDESYTIEQWLDDRITQRGMDHYSLKDFEAHDRLVQEAIAAARKGERRQTLTTLRRPAGEAGENPLVELVESDIRAVVAKANTLSKLGVDPHAYNEARKVFIGSTIKKRKAQELMAYATRRATDDLIAAGHSPKTTKNWDALHRDAYDGHFLRKREEWAHKEADSLIELLAKTEMYKATAEDIIRTFEERYTFDQQIREFTPGPITPFQKRSLEEAIKSNLSITDINDRLQVIDGLSRHGTRPPFESRGAMREYLQKYGFWSPRTKDAIESGKKSWSIQDEAKYYEDNWGTVPDWTNPELLREGGDLNEIMHNEQMYGEQNRKWGLFDRNMTARFFAGKLNREKRAQLMVEGSEALGMKAKRDLPSERRYVMERYGDLVVDGNGNLTAFPWLMHEAEFRQYMITRSQKGAIAEDLVQSAEELDVVEQLISAHMGRYFDEVAMRGRPVGYDEFFTLTAKITADVLADPIWLKRGKDNVGDVIRAQGAIRRGLVFTQLGFLTTNVIDSGIKGAWSRYTARAFHTGDVSAVARGYTALDFGFDQGTQLLHDVPVSGTTRWKEVGKTPRYYVKDGKVVQETARQKRTADLVERALAVSEMPAQGAGAAEQFTKLRLAQGMYDGVLLDITTKKGITDPALADAAAREYIRDEVSRLWPTVGEGPIERLFNQFSPFMSYQFKNRVLYIGELLAHPAFYNYFNHIGDYIEQDNRERWAVEHPGEVLPDHLARLIELPWSPGSFIDLGQFSDIQRGIKPVYQIADGEIVVSDFASNFIRLVSPNDQNFVYGILNAMGVPSHTEWLQGRDANGFPTGVWTEVEVPWEAPWGGTANSLNALWPVEWLTQGKEVIDSRDPLTGQFSVQEATQLFFQTIFFGGLKQYDRGSGLSEYYYALRSKDEAAAKEFLLSPDGAALKAWWAEKATETNRFFTPQDLKDLLDPPKADPNPWLHSQSDEFQAKVRAGWDDLGLIRKKWDAIIGELTPGTEEYRQAKLSAQSERWAYYKDHPWMYEAEVMGKTPADWAKQLEDWQLQDAVQGFFDIKAPDRRENESAAHFQQRLKTWRQQRNAYMKAFPQVPEFLAQSRSMVEGVWEQTEQGWFDLLDNIGRRSVALEAAKQSENYSLTDQLYLTNSLDYNVLSREVAVDYFNPKTDFETLPKGMQGPAPLRQGPFGQKLVSRVKVLPDFTAWRFGRMSDREKKDYRTNQRYAEGMAAVVAAAKRGGGFSGATFVAELKKDPWLLRQYFEKNPGKRAEWAATDDYIRQISKFGILMKQGKFDQGYEYFENLPDWVKARYYANNPGKKASAAKNLEYVNWMGRWIKFYKHRDYSGGASFFESMPKWVKDRYYQNHPDGFGRGGGSAYSRAMGKWVKLLQANKDEEAAEYFKNLPDAFRKRYYEGHPEAKLRDNIKRSGQLGEYFASDDANRAQYLKDHPDFKRWLAQQKDDKTSRAMLIMAGYRAIPADNQWMRRIYREKYPEVFSVEAKGKAAVAKVFAFLAEHPDMTPAFKRWYEEVQSTYAESLKNAGKVPKPLDIEHQRQHGMNQRRPHGGKSAAWVRIHSLS